MKESIWNLQQEKKLTLKKDMQVEIAVIGGGMAGILTAYQLKKAGYQVIVLEANQIGNGMTVNTTAKITSSHNLIYDYLLEHFGYDKAREYAIRNQEAIKEYKRIIKEERIACDFEQQDAYVYSTGKVDQIKKEVKACEMLGLPVSFTTETCLPFTITGAIQFKEQAAFHPIQFLQQLARGLDIYEGAMVTKIKHDHEIHVESERNEYKVEAKYIVITTHYPFINAPGYYFTKMHQERSYLIAAKVPDALPYGMYIGENNTGYSFRKYKDYVLIGGEAHRTGQNPEYPIYEQLEKAAKSYYQNPPIIYKWSNQDCITVDKVPYIGLFSKSCEHIYIATGFGKWGMSTSMVAACLIRDEICDHFESKDSIFSPQRVTMEGVKGTITKEMKTAVDRLTLQYLSVPKKYVEDVKIGTGDIVNIDGHKVGIYKETKERYYAVSTKCPHLGCMLSWNQDEKTWDCPCHGSRFDYKGRLIDNPAQTDLVCEVKKEK